MKKLFQEPNWKVSFILAMFFSMGAIFFSRIDAPDAQFMSIGMSLVALIGIVQSLFYREYMRLDRILRNAGIPVHELPMKREKIIMNLVLLVGLALLLISVGFSFPKKIWLFLLLSAWGISIILESQFYFTFAKLSKILKKNILGKPEKE